MTRLSSRPSYQVTSFQHHGRLDWEIDGKPRDEVATVRFRQRGELLIGEEIGGKITGESVADCSHFNDPFQVALRIQFGRGQNVRGAVEGNRRG